MFSIMSFEFGTSSALNFRYRRVENTKRKGQRCRVCVLSSICGDTAVETGELWGWGKSGADPDGSDPNDI